MSNFSMELACVWEDGKFTMLKETQADNNNNDEDDEDDDNEQDDQIEVED